MSALESNPQCSWEFLDVNLEEVRKTLSEQVVGHQLLENTGDLRSPKHFQHCVPSVRSEPFSFGSGLVIDQPELAMRIPTVLRVFPSCPWRLENQTIT